MEHRKNFISDQESLRIYFHTPRCILCFHSCGQHLCKFIGTKESVYIRKEFNSHRIDLGHKRGCRFIVLGHKYGRHDVMWKHTIMIIFSSLYDWLISLTSSVSLKMFLLSECPKITHSHPMSLIMAGLEAKTHLHYKIMIYMYSCKIIFAQTPYLSIHLILLQ